MLFQSTRNDALTADSVHAVLQGLAPDGGLYVPVNGELPLLAQEELLSLTYDELAAKVMGALLPDYTPAEMDAMVHAAYDGRFETAEVTPVVKAGDNYVLELYRGPTSAFKDVALCMLPRLVTAAREKTGMQEKIMILTATSGDTGKAALEGFHDVPGTAITVFYPEQGVSKVQKAQMTTQEGANVTVCAVRGNFDDAQTGVKKTFADYGTPDNGVVLSSANSINIGRLVPQVVYYVYACCELVRKGVISCGEPVDFVVPTGNFGDILAGWFAKKLGLPVGKLVCASNRNDVLTEFLSTGRYNRKREFFKTASPSMDILISSNLERLLYLKSGNAAQVAQWMKELNEKGEYTVPEAILQSIQEDFACGCCNEAETLETIGAVWNKEHYLMDTHTAVAWKVAEEYKRTRSSNAPVVVLSTASAYKFPASVLTALGETPAEDEFACIEQLENLSGVRAPEALRSLKNKPVLHTGVINKEEILPFVLSTIASK